MMSNLTKEDIKRIFEYHRTLNISAGTSTRFIFTVKEISVAEFSKRTSVSQNELNKYLNRQRHVLERFSQKVAYELGFNPFDYDEKIIARDQPLSKDEIRAIFDRHQEFNIPVVCTIRLIFRMNKTNARIFSGIVGVHETTISRVLKGIRPVTESLAQGFHKEFGFNPFDIPGAVIRKASTDSWL